MFNSSMSLLVLTDMSRTEALFASLQDLTEQALYVGVPSSKAKRPAPKRHSKAAAAKTKKGQKKTAKAVKKTSPKLSPITNALIGYMNEFGTARIPARPFLIPSITKNLSEIEKLLILDLDPETGVTKFNEDSLNAAGLQAQNIVRKYIVDQTGFKPLSPKTIQARRARRKSGKAGEKALIDTGSFINSITYVLDKGK